MYELKYKISIGDSHSETHVILDHSDTCAKVQESSTDVQSNLQCSSFQLWLWKYEINQYTEFLLIQETIIFCRLYYQWYYENRKKNVLGTCIFNQFKTGLNQKQFL